MSNKLVEQKAMDAAMEHEATEGRNPVIVSKKGVGYDIESDGRMIEVKGVSENWKTYTWQSLYPSSAECLERNPENFYLYIVKFNPQGKSALYIIPGRDLQNKFKLKVTAYALTPISKRKLREFLRSDEEV